MTGTVNVIDIYECFILGICRCGCNKELTSLRTKRGVLMLYKKGHWNQTGMKNPNWKGGRRKFGDYWFLWIPNYHNSQKNHVREHVYFYEQFNKCSMLKWGYVHHIDKNKENNMPWNLEGMMNNKHTILHMTGNNNREKDMSNRRCSICGSDKTWMRKIKDNKLRPNWYYNKIDIICGSCYQRYIKRK